jgi:hypothetical protein
MATEDQAKKEIAAKLRALRKILTQEPKQKYPRGLYEHSEVKTLLAEIERALEPHSEALDPDPHHFKNFFVWRCAPA